MQLALFGGVIVLLGIWLILRLRGQAQAPPGQETPPETGNTAFHAVSIKFEATACNAAKELGGRRFLSNAAPRLPLSGCDAHECRCRFAHHKDRRSGKDRRSPYAAAGFGGETGSFKRERRNQLDRRK